MAESATSTSAAPGAGTSFLERFRLAGVLAVLMGLVVGSAILTPQHTFVGPANLRTLLSLGAEFGIVAMGVGVLMIAGEFDLSVGSILVMCAFVFTSVLGATGSPFVAAFGAFACGLLIGFINGFIVVRGHIVSFIATLGTMLSLRGLVEILSRGVVRTVPVADHPVFLALTTGSIGSILSAQLVWFVLVAIALYILVTHTRFGNWIYATGDNAQAARAMGIRTGNVKIICFMIVGFLCAFAAILQTARLTAFSVHMGQGWELRAVAAAVVGGTSLQGGRGSVVGIFLGALIIIVVDNMISQLRLAYEWTYVVFGVVTLGSVLLDLWIERRIDRSAAASAGR
jgi:simple sugar transport system permease protein